tara:strand:- start:47 stop:571 length:525 start_codon:yes stop_codon:yes gene_type:complete
MEIIDDIADDIPNDKYVLLCKELKENYSDFEKIQDKIKEIEERQAEVRITELEEKIEKANLVISNMGKHIVLIEKFKEFTRAFLTHLNIEDIYRDALKQANDDDDDSKICVPLTLIKKRINNVRCHDINCSCCDRDSDSDSDDDDDDYKTKYKQLVERIKKTSKTQLQKLKNEL